MILLLQVLTSQSSDSALAQLQQFDADIEQLAGQQLPPAPDAEHAQPFQGARLSQTQPGAAAQDSTQRASVAAASASAELSAALESARQQLQAAGVPAQQPQQQQQQPVRTELDVSTRMEGKAYASLLMHIDHAQLPYGLPLVPCQ